MNITTPTFSNDFKLFESIINQGIDSHLEAFTKSNFEVKTVNGQNRLVMDFHKTEIPILLRRLRELENEDADLWADDIEGAENEN